MAAVTIWSDFQAPQNKVCHCFHCFPIYLPQNDGTRCHVLSFLVVEFKPTFSLSPFTFIKRLFSSSSLSAIRMVSSAYLRLLIFLPAILILACALSSQVFLMMYSAYKLNKQCDNIQPWHTSFLTWNQSVVPCLILLHLELHTGFSGGRSGGLVFPSLEEFSTVCWVYLVHWRAPGLGLTQAINEAHWPATPVGNLTSPWLPEFHTASPGVAWCEAVWTHPLYSVA